MNKKDFDKLYSMAILYVLIIVALFTIINKYSIKYAAVLIVSWVSFLLYNRILSELMSRDKISEYSWMILWLVGWMITISICYITKGV